MRKRLFILVGGLIFVGLLALVVTPHLAPWALGRWRSDICFRGASEAKRIFLTIDDAPSPGTAEILRTLKQHNVPATFFIIADRVHSHSQLQEIVAAGHSLGNHLRTTTPCSELSLEEFRKDFDACAATLSRVQPTRLFRPPSDFGTRHQMAYARGQGAVPVMGTVFPLDHWISNPTLLTMLGRWLSVRGGIVILHDGDSRGRTTANVLDQLIPKLKAAGYSFGRLDEIGLTAVTSPP